MPESPKQRIDDDDDAYRKHFLRSDITQALVIVGVIGIVGIAFARNDALLDEHDAYSNALLINRGVTSVVISWSAIVIARAKTGKTFDRALIAILMAIVLSTTHVLSTWQPNHLAYLPVNLVLVSVL